MKMMFECLEILRGQSDQKQSTAIEAVNHPWSPTLRVKLVVQGLRLAAMKQRWRDHFWQWLLWWNHHKRHSRPLYGVINCNKYIGAHIDIWWRMYIICNYIYMYIYIYMYTYIYTYIYIYVYIYICIHMCVYIIVCVCLCLCMPMIRCSVYFHAHEGTTCFSLLLTI